MILCHCAVVTSRHVTEALQAGARSVSEVCRRTGAAQGCGTCVFSVKQVVCEHVDRGGHRIEEAVRAAS
jgi:NAD(P)H-nitrite reductase large subunit